MNQAWDAILKIYTSVKDLEKNLQAKERARLMKLDEMMRTIEDTIARFEDSTAQAPRKMTCLNLGKLVQELVPKLRHGKSQKA